jgi:hypothetical protein
MYVRIQVTRDSDSAIAWSNPIYIELNDDQEFDTLFSGNVKFGKDVTVQGDVTATGAVTGSNINDTNWDTAFSHSEIITGNPHQVTPAEVGNSTAQWNANQIQSIDVDITGLADGDIMKYSLADNKFIVDAESGGSGAVDSVFGRTGAVVAVANDYTWTQIDKTTSDLNDLATKSHNSLTDIGTNTHAQIDTHIDDESIHEESTTLVHIDGAETINDLKEFTTMPQCSAVPSLADELVNVAFVEAAIAGVTSLPFCKAATTAALAASTYDNGTLGVGATLTADADGAFPDIDTISFIVGDILLVKDQADKEENGLYELTDAGGVSDPWILTRVTQYDESAEMNQGATTTVLGGSTNTPGSKWYQLTASGITVGTDDIEFQEDNPLASYTVSNGIKLVTRDIQLDLSDTNPSLEISDGGLRAKVDGTTVTRTSSGLTVGTITDSNISGAVAIAHGGTGLTSVGTANTVIGVNGAGSAFQNKILVAGDNMTITHTDGQIEFASTASSESVGSAYLPQQIDFVSVITPQAWSNMPLLLTALSTTPPADLTGATHYRLLVDQSVAGVAGADINLQYSVGGGAFLACDTASAGELDIGTGTGVKEGAWAELAADAKQSVRLRIVGKGGDGVVDPAFRKITAEFKFNPTLLDLSSYPRENDWSSLILYNDNTTFAVTNIPAAVTVVSSLTTLRTRFPLTNVSKYRIIVDQNIAGSVNAKFNLQYSLDNVTFADLDDTAYAGEVPVYATGYKNGAWADIKNAAKQDVYLRVVSYGGDGVADPSFRRVEIQFEKEILTGYTFADSIVDTDGTVTLVNDSATPGNSKYYGTDSGGTKGFFDLPEGGSGGGITWNEVTGTTQAMSVDNGYIANNVALVTLTLPSTAAVGKVIRVVGSGAGLWKVAQNANQYIVSETQTTATGTGGNLLALHRYDCVELLCITENVGWSIISMKGNVTMTIS